MLFPLAASTFSEEEVRFESYFEDQVLRVDLHHFGTADEERFALDELIQEPFYAGPRKNLIQERDLGQNRFDLFDAETGTRIFSRGFCTLFGEWRTTEEARRGSWKVFEHVLIAPFPKREVVLSLSTRNRKGGFEEIFREKLDLDPRFLRTENAFAHLDVVKLKVHGPPRDKLDVLLLGDGYIASEMNKYIKDARRVMDGLLSNPLVKEHRKKLNFWAVKSPSRESGADEPRKGIYKSTLFDTTFNTFDLPRYSMTQSIKKIHDVAACAPYDAIIIFFNSSRYGGGGIYNLYAMVTGDNPSPGVIVHEFGHHIAGLADEYYNSPVTYVDFYPEGVEPWEPNITALLDPKNPKWADLVEQGTPIPTPSKSKYDRVVGCFEGAGYRVKGLYRPWRRGCSMLGATTEFCPVCREAVLDAIRFYAK